MQNRPSPDLKSVVESREEMADIGEAFMEALNDVRDHAFMKHWAPADGPSEIIVDLLNALDDETSLLLTQKDRLDKLEALLDGRDKFIVSKGLWSEFTDQLPRALTGSHT